LVPPAGEGKSITVLSLDVALPSRSRLIDVALARALQGGELTDEEALALSEAPPELAPALLEAARARRDRAWGRCVTYSPKVFLPITNLCRNRCDYCAFRRSPGQAGEWTMTPDEVISSLELARGQHAFEALLCLGDKPESAFVDYRRVLASFGHDSTVDYLLWAGERALERGLLPHTNAGVLTREEMQRLRRVNVSLGLMLESVSERLCRPGGPHHRAPDKRPTRRLRMLREAGELAIPFTTGILIGIGETRRERMETLLAIRAVHRSHGHIQEVIVQNFTPHPGTLMADAVAPSDDEVEETIAFARVVLAPEVSVQSPPNLNAGRAGALLAAGINDFGGISAVTRDYINPDQPWPQIVALGAECARNGLSLEPRLAVYPSFVEQPGFVDPALLSPIRRAAQELSRGAS
jgi:FO synthase